MSSLYEKSQGTKIQITSAPATPETVGSATYLDLQCTIKEVQFTGGRNRISTSQRCVLQNRKTLTAWALSQKSHCRVTFTLTLHRMPCVKHMTTTPPMASKSFSLPGSASSSWLKFASTPGLQGQTA